MGIFYHKTECLYYILETTKNLLTYFDALRHIWYSMVMQSSYNLGSNFVQMITLM